MATLLSSLLLLVFLGTAYSQDSCDTFGIGVTVRITSASGTTLPASFSAPLDSSVSILCSVSLPTSSYRWYRNGVQLPQTQAQLVLTGIRGEDGGAYTCAGVLSSPSTCLTLESPDFTINISPDVVVNNPSQITTDIVEESSFTLDCSATGWPTPNLRWTKGGVVVSNTGIYTIESARFTDAGAYSCEAVNSEGNMTQIRVIRVLTTNTATEQVVTTNIMEGQMRNSFNETADQTGFYIGVGVVAGVSVAVTLLTVIFCAIFLCVNRAPPAAHNPYEDWPDGREPEETGVQLPEVVVDSQVTGEMPSAPPPMEAEPFQSPEDGEVDVPSAMPTKSEIGEVF